MAELQLGNIKPAGADNIVVEGKYVKGGYFVIDTYANLSKLKTSDDKTIVTGSLCYCSGDSKFYQYNGTEWKEKEFGTKSEATTDAAGLLSKEDKKKLESIAEGAEVNVQSDWNVTDETSDAFIKNKPEVLTLEGGAIKHIATNGSVSGFVNINTEKLFDGTYSNSPFIEVLENNSKDKKYTSISANKISLYEDSQEYWKTGINLETINGKAYLQYSNSIYDGLFQDEPRVYNLLTTGSSDPEDDNVDRLYVGDNNLNLILNSTNKPQWIDDFGDYVDLATTDEVQEVKNTVDDLEESLSERITELEESLGVTSTSLGDQVTYSYANGTLTITSK